MQNLQYITNNHRKFNLYKYRIEFNLYKTKQ